MVKIILIFIVLLPLSYVGQNNSELLYPKNNQYVSDTVGLVWSEENGATAKYFVDVAYDSFFINQILSDSTLTNNYSFYVDTNATIYWRVGLRDLGSTVLWSEIEQFNLFHPENYDTLKLWYMAEYTNVVLSGDSVVAIKNAASISHTANVISATAPKLNSEFAFDYIDFSGNQLFQFNTLNLQDSATIFMMVKVVDDYGDIVFSDFNGQHYVPNVQTASKLFYRSSVSSLFSGSNIQLDQWYILSFNREIDTVTIQRDFTSLGQGIGAFNDFTIDYFGATGSGLASFEGGVTEVLMYDKSLTQLEMDDAISYLMDKYGPRVSLGANRQLNYFCPDTISPDKYAYQSYLWSTNSLDSLIYISESGWYSVDVVDVFGRASTDSIYIEFPVINNVINDTICLGDTLPWNTNLDNTDFTFLWSDASTDSILNITQVGDYWVRVTDSQGCFRYSDTLTIAVDSFPVLTTLGPDKTICQGASLGLVSNTTPTSYLWNTAAATPQIVINTAGQYWLQSNNVNGCINKDTINIVLNGIAPTVGFSTLNACTNELTNFTDTSFTTDGSSIISWLWSFEGGDVSVLQNPQYNYPLNNTYNVTLEVLTDSGCENSVVQSVEVHSPPVAGFFTVTNPICSSADVDFSENSFSNDGTINSWFWDFGDVGVNDTSSVQNGSYIYGTTNNYNVQLVVATTFLCKDTISNLITVKEAPVASFSVSDGCVDNATQFANSSSGQVISQLWDFGDFNTSNTISPSNVYNSSGTYDVSLNVTELNGCTDTVSSQIIIHENPVANFTVQDYCVAETKQLFDISNTQSGVISNWSWNVVGHINQSTQEDPSFSFSTIDTGTYFIDLVIETDLGCTDSVRSTINVYPLPVPQFSFNPLDGEPPLSLTFTNMTHGVNSYLWNFGEDITSTEINPAYLYQDLGDYTVNLVATTSLGCVDSLSKLISVRGSAIDVGVVAVEYDFVSGTEFLKVTARLMNFGTVEISSADIVLEMSNNTKILEKWEGSISTLHQLNYEFTGVFEIVGGEIPDLLCVSVLNPNNTIDDNNGNNEFCISTENFLVIAIGPNPTAHFLNIDYIVPSSGEISISLYNLLGEKVKSFFNGKVESGVNRESFNVKSISSGVYVVELLFGEQSIKKKIIIR